MHATAKYWRAIRRYHTDSVIISIYHREMENRGTLNIFSYFWKWMFYNDIVHYIDYSLTQYSTAYMYITEVHYISVRNSFTSILKLERKNTLVASKIISYM